MCCIAKTASLEPDAWQMHAAVSYREQNPSLPAILQLLLAKQYSNRHLRCCTRLAHLKIKTYVPFSTIFFPWVIKEFMRKPFPLPQFSCTEANISMNCSSSLFHNVKFQRKHSGCFGYALNSSLPQAVA